MTEITFGGRTIGTMILGDTTTTILGDTTTTILGDTSTTMTFGRPILRPPTTRTRRAPRGPIGTTMRTIHPPHRMTTRGGRRPPVGLTILGKLRGPSGRLPVNIWETPLRQIIL